MRSTSWSAIPAARLFSTGHACRRRGARALPRDPAAAPHPHGRGVRRVRLGGRRLRTGLRRARAVAVRDEPRVPRARAARRVVGGRSDCARPGHARPRDDRRRDLRALAGGPRPASVRLRPGPGANLRPCPRAGACRAGRSRRPTPRPSWPTPSPRFGSRPARRWPAPSSSSGSICTRSVSGRCSGSPRPSRPASRPASTLAREARRRPTRPACRDRRRPRARRGARAMGAVRCSRTTRFARSGCAKALAALLGGADGLWAAAMRRRGARRRPGPGARGARRRPSGARRGETAPSGRGPEVAPAAPSSRRSSTRTASG